LGVYREGNALHTGGTGYKRQLWEGALEIYRHEVTGIAIWSQALDLAEPTVSVGNLEVLFHYVSVARFRELTDFSQGAPGLWSGPEAASGPHGKGVYTTRREPGEFRTLEAAAWNKHSTQIQKDPSSMASYVEQVPYCVAIIAPKEHCFNVKRRATPEMIHGPGKTVLGEAMAQGCDVWVIQSPDREKAIRNVATNSEACLRREFGQRECSLGGEHPSTLVTATFLASCLWAQGNRQEAEPLLRRALAGCDKALGANHPYTLNCVGNLAQCVEEQGMAQEAEELFERVLAGFETSLGEHHVRTLEACGDLAECFHEHGKLEEAERLHRRALAGFEKALGSEHQRTLQSAEMLGFVLSTIGKKEKCTSKSADMVDTPSRERSCMKNDFGARNCFLIGILRSDRQEVNQHGSTGPMQEAEILFRRIKTAREHRLGMHNLTTLQAFENLGMFLGLTGRHQEAIQHISTAFAGFQTLCGVMHPNTQRCAKELVELRDMHSKTA